VSDHLNPALQKINGAYFVETFDNAYEKEGFRYACFIPRRYDLDGMVY